jgi:diadenosine tetraphosphate (Ap4A) HIT family hydrolase
MSCDLCAVIDPTGPGGTLQQHLRPGQDRHIATNADAVAVPSIGALVPGYVLVAARVHTTSLGLLPTGVLSAVEQLAEQMVTRLQAVYGLPVLGFEYGLNQPGARRVEHAHLHLMPTEVGAAFRTTLGERLPTHEVDRLLRLPSLGDRSYICVWGPGQPVAVHPVANDARPRIRLREILADLDPRLDTAQWDWETHPGTALIRATIDDLATAAQRDVAESRDHPATDPADATARAGA